MNQQALEQLRIQMQERLLNPQQFVLKIRENIAALSNSTNDIHKAEVMLIHPIVRSYYSGLLCSDDLTVNEALTQMFGLKLIEDTRVGDYKVILLDRNCVEPPLSVNDLLPYSRLQVLVRPMAVREVIIEKGR